MEGIKITSLEISTIIHATEDDEKVKKAVFQLIPENLRNKVRIKEYKYKGYHGNPITLLTIMFRGKSAEEVLKYIGQKLDDLSKRILETSLELRYDITTCKLYLRFDKQEAYRGNIILYDGDDCIKVVVSLTSTTKPQVKDLKELLKEYGVLWSNRDIMNCMWVPILT